MTTHYRIDKSSHPSYGDVWYGVPLEWLPQTETGAHRYPYLLSKLAKRHVQAMIDIVEATNQELTVQQWNQLFDERGLL